MIALVGSTGCSDKSREVKPEMIPINPSPTKVVPPKAALVINLK